MIVVAGEALIDLIDDGGAFRPHPGGGPFNMAVALGCLGAPVGFLGRLSNDRFGQLLAARFAESGVDARYVLRGRAPTPLAVVHDLPDGDHEFTFYLAETAYAQLDEADLPQFGPEVTTLSAGTLALATDPPGGALEALLEREAQHRLIVIDPNVRPDVFGDPQAYRHRLARWAGFAHVVKLSDEDAEWLYPGQSLETVLDALLERGVRLAVVTRGAEGALAKTRAGRAVVGTPGVDVVDSVGAGDAFGAGLLRWLWANDRLAAEAVGSLGDEDLAEGLGFAAAVGALQCSRAGAAPSTLAEVEAFVVAHAAHETPASG
jgi:fructokinase